MDGQARVNIILELKNKIRAGLGQARDALNRSVQDVRNRIQSLRNTHVEAFRQMRDEVPALSRAVQLATNPFVLMAAAIVSITAALGKASAKAQEFDTAMAHANVTANMSQADLKKTGNQLLNTASNSTTKGAAVAAPNAYNVLLSSGMEEQSALAATAPTLEAAKAGFADIETTARAAAASMNSSGIKDANRVYDVLFATLNKGNAEFKDVAQYLPRIVPAALQVGSSFEETAGAFAYFTAQGNTSERSATLLENAFKSLADPAKAKAFKDIGVNVYDAHGKLKSLVDISTDLHKALAGLHDDQKAKVLDSIGLDMESGSAFATLSKDVKSLKETIDFTTNSAGQFKLAVNNAKTPMDSWVVIGNKIDVMWIKLGQTVNSILGPIGQWLVDHRVLIEFMAYALTGAAVAWGVYGIVTNAAAIATGVMTVAQWALNTALNANPIGIIITGIGLLVGGFVYAYQKSEKFRAVLAGLLAVAKIVMDVFIGLGKVVAGAFTLNLSLIKEGVTQSATAVSTILQGGIKKAYDAAYDESIKSSRAKEEELKPAAGATPTKDAKDLYTAPNDKVKKVLEKEDKKLKDKEKDKGGVTGSQQVRNITINKVTFFEGGLTTNNKQFGEMSPKELEKTFEEMFGRMIIGLGRSYS